MVDEIIVDDNDVIVLMPKKAIVPGQIIVTPKQEFNILEQIPDELIAKMFQIANKMSSILFENFGAQGTNILVQNGASAGQINKRFSINVLPRKENDGITLDWDPKQATPEELDAAVGKFKALNEEAQEKKFIEEQKTKVQIKEEKEELKDDEENYLVKSLDRTG